ncbi:MAG: hypothetical protein RQ847_00550 [Wenzhouxiangellaceae bacterium]|nr:hypothetical protein [Wenzhouxiangellaceae bacterium]
MKASIAILLTTLLTGAVFAADGAPSSQSWRLPVPDDRPHEALDILFPGAPLGFGRDAAFGQRPRLTVAVSPSPGPLALDGLPSFSWSLEAWEMNTASLAHIQCSRATRTIETFVVEDCRFVDRPLPDNSPSLVQVRGRWMAAPGLNISAGAFAGHDSAGDWLSPVHGAIGLGPVRDEIRGVNFNVSFGLRMGQIGDLLLDLQLERYRRTPDPFSFSSNGPSMGLGPVSPFDNAGVRIADGGRYANASQIGVGWRGQNFGADLTGQYQELPYWFGDQLQGEGFRSFDLEFSWRAPARSSISVGVSNVLDRLPGAAHASKQHVEETVDGIFGRIPYVRYKHDL